MTTSIKAINKKKAVTELPTATEQVAEVIADAKPTEKLVDLVAQAEPVPEEETIKSLAVLAAENAMPHIEINGIVIQAESEVDRKAGGSFDLGPIMENTDLAPWALNHLFKDVPPEVKLYLYRFKDNYNRDKIILASPGSVYVVKPQVSMEGAIIVDEDDFYMPAPRQNKLSMKADFLMLVNSRAENVAFMGTNEINGYPLVSNCSLSNANIKNIPVEKRDLYYVDSSLKNGNYHRGYTGKVHVVKGADISDSTIISSTVRGVSISNNSTIVDSMVKTNMGGIIRNSSVVESVLQAHRLNINAAQLAVTIDSVEEVQLASIRIVDLYLWNTKKPVKVTNRFGFGKLPWTDGNDVVYFASERGVVLRLPYSLGRFCKESNGYGHEVFIPYLNHEAEVRELIHAMVGEQEEKEHCDLSDMERSLYRYLLDSIDSRINVLIEINKVVNLGRTLLPRNDESIPF